MFQSFIQRDQAYYSRCVMSLEQEILDELRKIREAVTPKPAPPPPPPPKGLLAEFVDFIGKYGVLGLAVGFVIGLYVGKVVSALVTDIIMPIPGAFLPSGDWRKAVVSIPVGNGINLAIGDFVGVLIDFIIVAFVVFLIARYARKMGIK
ncbi:MAG: MscL family protein [Candidatus Bathyarchaeia archaeon]